MVTRIKTLDVGQVITINKGRSKPITPPDNGGGLLLGYLDLAAYAGLNTDAI